MKLCLEESINRLQARVYEQQGMHVFHLNCADRNKTFALSVKTPPENDHGTAHMVEHMVFCGSEQYRCKEPFQALVKNSLYTYLNALTFHDRTVFPIASYIDSEYDKMLDVYIDAVFKPLFPMKREVFFQEKPIVHSEMQGTYTDGIYLCQKTAYRHLFADSQAFDSAGVPEGISLLNFEECIAFYNRQYRPENTCVYVYGDADLNRVMERVMERVSTRVENSSLLGLGTHSVIEEDKFKNKLKDKHESKRKIITEYFCCESLKSLSGIFFPIGRSRDVPLMLSLLVLEGYFKDFFGGESITTVFDVEMEVPVMGFITENLKFTESSNQSSQFYEYIDGRIRSLCREGLDKEKLHKQLDALEFWFLDEDFGYRPCGVQLCFHLMRTWASGQVNFDWLKANEYIMSLRNKVTNGYFDELLRVYFVENKYSLALNLLNQHKALKTYLAFKEPEAELLKIPALKIDSIKENIYTPAYEQRSPNLFFVKGPEGMAYVDLYFDLSALQEDAWPCFSILPQLLLSQRSLLSVFSKISIQVEIFGEWMPKLVIRTRFPDKASKEAFGNLVNLFNFDISEKMLLSTMSDIQSKLTQENRAKEHNLAIGIDLSRITFKHKVFNQIRHRVLDNGMNLLDNNILKYTIAFFERIGVSLGKPTIFVCGEARLGSLAEKFFENHQLLPQMPEDSALKGIGPFPTGNPLRAFTYSDFCHKPINRISIHGQELAFSGLGCAAKGFTYTGGFHGSMAVCARLLEQEYFYQSLRLENGAYDYGLHFSPNGYGFMFSFRDPKAEESIEVFKGCAAFLKKYVAEAAQVQDLSIGTLNALNHHLKPKHVSEELRLLAKRFFLGITKERLAEFLSEIKSTDDKKISGYIPIFEHMNGEFTLVVL